MNDLIKDLATKAIVENITSDRWVFNDAELEKFAELIVRECAYIMDKDADHPFVSRGSILKHHFGVEE